MIQCGDKYGMRRYVEEKGCSELLNELYGVYDSADEIDFSVLPQKFVLKITNACGYNIICDKADLDEQQVRTSAKKMAEKTVRAGHGRAALSEDALKNYL